MEFGRTVAVKIYGREVESVTVAEPRGLGVRAVRDGRVGYAFTADLSHRARPRARRSRCQAAAADPDPFVRLPEPPAGGYAQLDRPVARRGVRHERRDKMRLALEAEAAALACRRHRSSRRERVRGQREPDGHRVDHWVWKRRPSSRSATST